MRRKLSLVAVLALVIAVAGASLAFAGDSGDGDATVVKLVAKTIKNTELDLGDKGFGQGDQFVETDDLYLDGKKVGTLEIVATATRVEESGVTFQAAVTASLPKGDVTHQGIFTAGPSSAPEPFFLAITGGTGDYRTADGETEVTIVSDTEARLEVKLVP